MHLKDGVVEEVYSFLVELRLGEISEMEIFSKTKKLLDLLEPYLIRGYSEE